MTLIMSFGTSSGEQDGGFNQTEPGKKEASNDRRRAVKEVKKNGRNDELGLQFRHGLDQPKLGQSDRWAQADGQGAALKMAGRAFAIGGKACFGVKEIDEQRDKENKRENSRTDQPASSSAHG